MRGSAVALALVVALTACTWSRTERIGPIDPWPPRLRLERPPSLAIRLYGVARFEGAPRDIEQSELMLWREEALRAYRESGLFSNVETTWKPAELIAEISLSKSTGEPKLLPILLFGIPARQTGLVMRTRFRRPDGSLIRMLELSEDIVSARIYLAPYGESQASLRTILYDLHRGTLAEAASGGWLEAAAQEEP